MSDSRQRLPTWISVDLADSASSASNRGSGTDNARIRSPKRSPYYRHKGHSKSSTPTKSSTKRSNNLKKSPTNSTTTSTGSPKNAATMSKMDHLHLKQPHHKKRNELFHTGVDLPEADWQQVKLAKKNENGPSIPRESWLVSLCKKQKWKEALLQVQEHPEQAEPITLSNDDDGGPEEWNLMDLGLNNDLHSTGSPNATIHTDTTMICHETALHFLCANANFQQDPPVKERSTMAARAEDQEIPPSAQMDPTKSNSPSSIPRQLFRELLAVAPKQAIVHNKQLGHTALRALLRNASCTPDLLQTLLQTMKQQLHKRGQQDKQNATVAFQNLCTQPDSTGWRPLDHILMALHHPTAFASTYIHNCNDNDNGNSNDNYHDAQANTNTNMPLELIKVLVQHVGGDCLLFGLTNNHDNGRDDSDGDTDDDDHGRANRAMLLLNAKQVPPLIRLLSLNHSYSGQGVNHVADQHNHFTNTTTTTPTTQQSKPSPSASASASAILCQATNYFLREFPRLIDQTSTTTSCTPLHVALRNHGNNLQLIECFSLLILPILGTMGSDTDASGKDDGRVDEEDEESNENSESALVRLDIGTAGTGNYNSRVAAKSILACLRTENMYGDLPLHVACSVGTPVSVLRLVLEGTLRATSSSSSSAVTTTTTTTHNRNTKNLCWALNHAGYTPIDLEWIRHMEDGKGFFMARSFYSLEAGGVKKTFWKQDEFYRVLLQQAVQQAMETKSAVGASITTRPAMATTTTTTTTTPVIRRRHQRILTNMQSSPQQHSPASTPRGATLRTANVNAPPAALAPTALGTGLAAVATPLKAPPGTCYSNDNPQRIPAWQQPQTAPPRNAASTTSPRTSRPTRTATASAATTTTATTRVPPQPSEQPTWELLLHRIFLIIQTAATGAVPKTQTDLEHCLLHAACQLSFPVAPSLPLPLLELILFLYPDQLLMAHQSSGYGKQPQGNLPLHYAVQPQVPSLLPPKNARDGTATCSRSSSANCTCFQQSEYHGGSKVSTISSSSSSHEIDEESSKENQQHICDEWEKWVKQLLEHGPQACSTRNQDGQLPLHKALEYISACSFCSDNWREKTDCSNQPKKKNHSPFQKRSCFIQQSPPEEARMAVIQALVDAYPDSVEVKDPVSHLMPFQMAAASPYMPLDAVFYLLRRSPDAVIGG